MLYINENEKKHIKSLYYTKVINEQGYNQNITGSYVQPAPKNLQIDWNKIIEKYNIRT